METSPRISHVIFPFGINHFETNFHSCTMFHVHTQACLCNETLIKGNLRCYANELRSDPMEHGVILNELMASSYSLIVRYQNKLQRYVGFRQSFDQYQKFK
jgi:hypothetical protein